MADKKANSHVIATVQELYKGKVRSLPHDITLLQESPEVENWAKSFKSRHSISVQPGNPNMVMHPVTTSSYNPNYGLNHTTNHPGYSNYPNYSNMPYNPNMAMQHTYPNEAMQPVHQNNWSSSVQTRPRSHSFSDGNENYVYTWYSGHYEQAITPKRAKSKPVYTSTTEVIRRQTSASPVGKGPRVLQKKIINPINAPAMNEDGLGVFALGNKDYNTITEKPEPIFFPQLPSVASLKSRAFRDTIISKSKIDIETVDKKQTNIPEAIAQKSPKSPKATTKKSPELGLNLIEDPAKQKSPTKEQSDDNKPKYFENLDYLKEILKQISLKQNKPTEKTDTTEKYAVQTKTTEAVKQTTPNLDYLKEKLGYLKEQVSPKQTSPKKVAELISQKKSPKKEAELISPKKSPEKVPELISLKKSPEKMLSTPNKPVPEKSGHGTPRKHTPPTERLEITDKKQNVKAPEPTVEKPAPIDTLKKHFRDYTEEKIKETKEAASRMSTMFSESIKNAKDSINALLPNEESIKKQEEMLIRKRSENLSAHRKAANDEKPPEKVSILKTKESDNEISPLNIGYVIKSPKKLKKVDTPAVADLEQKASPFKNIEISGPLGQSTPRKLSLKEVLNCTISGTPRTCRNCNYDAFENCEQSDDEEPKVVAMCGESPERAESPKPQFFKSARPLNGQKVENFKNQADIQVQNEQRLKVEQTEALIQDSDKATDGDVEIDFGVLPKLPSSFSPPTKTVNAFKSSSSFSPPMQSWKIFSAAGESPLTKVKKESRSKSLVSRPNLMKTPAEEMAGIKIKHDLQVSTGRHVTRHGEVPLSSLYGTCYKPSMPYQPLVFSVKSKGGVPEEMSNSKRSRSALASKYTAKNVNIEQ